jgi:putative ABC transport system ATP-binding protein
MPQTQDPYPLVFRARSLIRDYASGAGVVHALRGVDLDIGEGELIVLLGPSGSGKSTLLNLLGGLDTPTGGSLTWRSLDLAHADSRTLTRYRREQVGFVFQFYNLIASLTARENVRLVTDLVAKPMDEVEALRRVGLAERLEHFPAQLSGGEQQRVAIARAIAKRPDVLLCDEPTGALDYPTGKQVLEVLESVNLELGTTTILITHNASIAAMASRVLRLADGQLIEDRMNASRLRPSELSW